ncbi:MAG: hypothetical protein FWB97_03455 [Oscillospiraceae bacterium]|nr:hypothetical protein [Oscillospiraceae bacterium]
MHPNDLKQLIIDTIHESAQAQKREQPRGSSPQVSGAAQKSESDISKKILVFLSILMFITSSFVKYMQLVEGIDVADLKVPMATLYGSSIGFYQIRKGLESRGKNGNGQLGNHSDAFDKFEDFD